MVEQTILDSTSAVRVQIRCDGRILPDLPLLSLSVRRAFNRISWARLEILDGDMAKDSLKLADSNTFVPGAKIAIQLGYGKDVWDVFSGLVVRHGVRMDVQRVGQLEIECRDEAFRMMLDRTNANYIKRKDSDVIRALVDAHGLEVEVDETGFEHPELVQYYCSDWDFMLARAEFNGLLVDAADGKVRVASPRTGGREAFELTWGDDLYDFEADIDARLQHESAQAAAWDAKRQQMITGSEARPLSLVEQGNLDGSALAKAAGAPKLRLQTATQQEPDILSAWAKSSQLRAELGRIRGRLRCAGTPLAVPGVLVKVNGLGERFSGKILVSAVEHSLGEGEWYTDIEFGLDPDWHMMRDDVQAPAAAGLLPGVGGLQIGVVLKLDGDPQDAQRIQIKLPVMQAETEGVWARMLQFYGSSEFGAFFPPEVGDEVIVGYLNDDPCHPVVLGSVYSSKRQPPYPLEADNDIKAIVTRSRHQLVFDEKDKILTIATPGGNTLVLDDKDQSALLQDQHGNTIKLSKDGIALSSPSDISLKAGGNIKLKAEMGIEAQAQADVKVQGLNVNLEAQVGFVGKGAATAELSASGQTVVRGGLVLIN
ncbi:type VI secretion system tip protein VgrG [Chromobacterium subtsugae]|uniref:type VI secretion system tip protein VgrG n=1 Tax=Chromobacterium subtsugae TaxID=251747 RepID=UPI000641177B|nr:type VI secretion system tip protein VgrG [Chromobacterium subtsugae]